MFRTVWLLDILLNLLVSYTEGWEVGKLYFLVVRCWGEWCLAVLVKSVDRVCGALLGCLSCGRVWVVSPALGALGVGGGGVPAAGRELRVEAVGGFRRG